MGMKKCNKCNVDLIVGDNITLKGYNNADYNCKPCRTAYRVKHRQNNRSIYRAANKKYDNKHEVDGCVVYYLPEFNYVGVSKNMYARLKTHKYQQDRDVKEYVILHTFDNRKDALAKEKEYHNMGYNG